MKSSRIQQRTLVIAVNIIVAVLVGALLIVQSVAGRAGGLDFGALFALSSPHSTAQEKGADAELAARLRQLCDRAEGAIAVAVTHVETGRTVEIQGTTPLPLYSVFKLPLAIAVLKEVEENRLRLDQQVQVTAADISPGSKENTDLWRKPTEKTIKELMGLSIGRSDNTSSDKLLQLIGGPGVVTQRMRALGFQQLDISSTVREMASGQGKPNMGTASDLARLLAGLQQGQFLQPSQRTLLIGMMQRAVTGLHRLRGDLPAGTIVAHKTGTGDAGSATNDVGLITLPEGKGHLAMVVLISGSKLPAEAQEKLIAELAKATYDFYTSQDRQGSGRQSQSGP